VVDDRLLVVGSANLDPRSAIANTEASVGIDRPLLLDADGLYALGDELELLAGRAQPTVITPHEGELGRLIGRALAFGLHEILHERSPDPLVDL